MVDTNSNFSQIFFSQNTPSFLNDQISLPLVPNKTSFSGHASNNKKERIIFQAIQKTEGNFEKLAKNDFNKENQEQLNKGNFARQVQKKLHLVVGQFPQETQQSEYEIDSEDIDFEAKIKENKKIIQQNRLKKEHRNSEIPKDQITPKSQQPWERKKKNESLYEKHTKQSKGQSIENKNMAQKKVTSKQKNISSQNNIHPARKRQNTQRKNTVVGKVYKNYSRAISHKESNKCLMANEVHKNEGLFEGIQNYLQNPRFNKKPEEQKYVGLDVLKVKREIEDKIRDINQRLGLQEETCSDKQKCLNVTAGGWRRVEISNKNLDSHYSNFEDELQRIGSLQERSSYYLEQYVEYQKMLVGLKKKRSVEH